MKEQLYRVLNIKATEAKLVFHLLCVQLFSGIGTSFLFIVSLYLFLHTFSIQLLPVIYILIAFLLLIVNILYEKIEHNSSPVKVLKIVFIISIITLVILWIGIINSERLIFILVICTSVLYMLTGYAFWGFASLLFNIRESKRVFSIIGSGDIPSKLIGYLAVPLILPIVGTDNLVNLLWVCIVAFIIALLLVIKLFDNKPELNSIAKEHKDYKPEISYKKSPSFINVLFKTDLILYISLLSIITYTVFSFIDFTFLSQVKEKFSDSKDLATFISIFFAGGRILALFFKLLFTSRIITKWGIIYSLLISPIVLFICCIAVFLFGDELITQLYLFGAMVLLTEVLRSTIQEPVFLIIFQPLKTHLRLKGHIIAKGQMLVPALIIVGATLLLLSNSGIAITISLIVGIVVVNILLWALVIFFIQKAYLSALHESVKKGIFDGSEIFTDDPRTIQLLIDKADKGKNTEIIYALTILESINYQEILPLLESKLDNKEKEVKKYVIKRLHHLQYNTSGIIGKLRFLLTTETDPQIKNLVIDALMALDHLFFSQYANKFVDLEPELKKIVIIHLLTNGEFNELLPAANELNNLITSENAEDRIMSLDIIMGLKNMRFNKIIKRLLDDGNVSVRKKVIQSIIVLKIDELLPSIIQLLDQPSDKFFALKSLIEYGDCLFDPNRNLLSFNNNTLIDFVKISGKIKGLHSTNFLLNKLDSSVIQKNFVLNALWEKKYYPIRNEEKKIETALTEIIQQVIYKTESFYTIGEFADAALLKRAVLSEVKTDLITILQTVSMLYDSKNINQIIEVFNFSANSKIHNAIEMLEFILPKKKFHQINQIIDFTLNPETNGNHRKKTKELQTCLEEIVYSNFNCFSTWTRALSIYIAGRNNCVEFIRNLKLRPVQSEEFVIYETLNFISAGK